MIEFSTSGCRIMLGTTMSRLPSSISFSTTSRAEADALDVEVLVDRLELLAQRDEVILAAQQAPQQRRQLDDQHARRFGCDRISDEIDVSVLNRKCGLI